MDISLNDLKAALGRAQECGFTEAGELAAFAFGYLSAGPLTEGEKAMEREPDHRIGMAITSVEELNALPVGTEVRDDENDLWVQFAEREWAWTQYANGSPRLEPDEYYDNTNMLESAFPAYVRKIGD